MKHIESILLASVVGAAAFYAINQTMTTKVTEKDSDAITTGALIGAIVQITMRLTGVS